MHIKSRHILAALGASLALLAIPALEAQEAPIVPAARVATAIPGPGPSSPSPARVVILDYHSFLGNTSSNIDLSLEELAAQLDSMSALGWTFATLQDAMAGTVTGTHNVVVTIDDGNHSVYRAWKEVFQPRGIRPFLFVYPAVILGGKDFALTGAQLREMAAAGCGIGAHGYHHNPVSDKAYVKDPVDFMAEIRRPAGAIERLTGARPLAFAYPFGVFSSRAKEALAAEGYLWAFAADENIVPVAFSDPRLDHLAVPRTIVYRYIRPIIIRQLKALGAGD